MCIEDILVGSYERQFLVYLLNLVAVDDIPILVVDGAVKHALSNTTIDANVACANVVLGGNTVAKFLAVDRTLPSCYPC